VKFELDELCNWRFLGRDAKEGQSIHDSSKNYRLELQEMRNRDNELGEDVKKKEASDMKLLAKKSELKKQEVELENTIMEAKLNIEVLNYINLKEEKEI
jgi:seryl-tRNA synthetase